MRIKSGELKVANYKVMRIVGQIIQNTTDIIERKRNLSSIDKNNEV